MSHLNFSAPSRRVRPSSSVHRSPCSSADSQTTQQGSGQVQPAGEAPQGQTGLRDVPGQSRREEGSDGQAAPDALRQGSPPGQGQCCDVLGLSGPGQEDSSDAIGKVKLSPEEDSHGALEKANISDSQGSGDGNIAYIVL